MTPYGAVHKLRRLKLGDFWPPPPLLSFLLSRIYLINRLWGIRNENAPSKMFSPDHSDCRGSLPVSRIGKNKNFFFWFMPNSQLVARQRKEVTHPSLWYGHTARLLNTILNSSFTIDIQSGLPDDCLKSSLQLPDYCLMTAWLVPDECLVLTEDCLMNAWRLPDDYLTTAWWLHNP